ncbi:MAG: efflux RND transporter permease subunit, partial [Planctomycetes bacterium]|nr:efflux RND transporter permease subunit [Planctomycetota bacterium]
MSIPSFSVKNHVLVNMMMIVILVGGAIFAFTLVKEMFPESRPNKLAVTAIYPANQPDQIEKAITIKVEEAVRDIDGIEKVDSSVREGISATILTLYNEVKDVDTVLQEVQAEIDAIENLPDKMEKITVKKLEPRLPVISVALFGEGSEAELKRAARKLRDDLLLLPGITDVHITGTREDEISVEIRPDQLEINDVTFDEVATAIRETNLDVSAGQLKGKRQTISVRTKGEKLHGRDLEKIVVRSQLDGSTITVGDVAIVRDAFVESDLESYFNAQRSVNCTVYKSRSEDTLQIAMLVRAYIAGKQNADFDPYGFNEAFAKPWYSKPFALIGSGGSWFIGKVGSVVGGRPDPMTVYEESRADPFDHNLEVALHTNLARFIEGRLDLMMRNGKTGLVLVVLSLMLFLNWRVAFWAAVGLPVSFFGTFIIMWALGATINLLTLFGLIIVLGIIVDDAIVIGENIYRHIEEGMPPLQAAVKGTEEVMWPVTIAVLTTIAAFAPLFFIRGQIGDFMGQLPIVVLAALSVSLIEALMILPAHLAHMPSKEERERKRLAREQAGGFSLSRRLQGLRRRMGAGRLMRVYERILRFTLRWRYVTIAVSVSLFMTACGMLAGGVVERVFIQEMDSETLICSLEMPVGTNASQVKDRLDELARLATNKELMPEVVNVQAFVARQYDLSGAGTMAVNDQSHLGQLVIELKPADQRELHGERSSMKLLTVFRKASDRLAGVNSVTWLAMSGGPGGKDIHIKVAGEDLSELAKVAEELKQALGKIAGVYDLDDDIDRGKREVQIEPTGLARIYGVSKQQLGEHIRSALYGREARRLTRNREDVKIMVRYPKSSRETMADLESVKIPVLLPERKNPSRRAGRKTRKWAWIPLKELAQLSEVESLSTINRSQQKHSVTVFGAIDEGSGTNTTEVLEKIRVIFDTTTDGHVFQINDDYVTVEWLEIKDWQGSSSEAFRVNGTKCHIRYCIMHDAKNGNGASDGVYLGS